MLRQVSTLAYLAQGTFEDQQTNKVESTFDTAEEASFGKQLAFLAPSSMQLKLAVFGDRAEDLNLPDGSHQEGSQLNC